MVHSDGGQCEQATSGNHLISKSPKTAHGITWEETGEEREKDRERERMEGKKEGGRERASQNCTWLILGKCWTKPKGNANKYDHMPVCEYATMRIPAQMLSI